MILAVGRNPRNLELLTDLLAKQGYPTNRAASLEKLDDALERAGEIALALVDVAGFDAGIWQRCDRLRESGVPFVIISAKQLADVEQQGVVHGARGVLVKPLVMKQLLGVVRGLLEA